MPDVFLSYSRDDQRTAQAFAEALQRAGLTVWWDQTLSAGQAYDEVTEKALEEAKAVVVLWSKASVASRWVRAEATTADRNGTLVPVMIEDCKRPVMFELRQSADLTHWKGDTHDPAWQRFVAGLLDVVSGGQAAMPARPAPSPPSAARRIGAAPIVAVSVAVLLLAGGAYWFLHRGAPASGSKSVPAAEAIEPSIAVLPLKDFSPGQDQGYFVDGITEEILNSLARIPGLKVTARTSAFAYKGKDVNLQEVGKTLGVANILEGSLRKEGDQLRITLQLIDTQTDTHRWSKTYDRPYKDVFAIQEDIARSVADALQISLGVGAGRAPGMTRNVEAFEAFLAALPPLQRAGGTPQEVRLAISQAQKAIQLDPDFTQAYGVLYGLYQLAPLMISDEPAQAWSERIDALLARLQERFPDALETHESFARRAWQQLKWSEAVAAYARAAVVARKQGITRIPPPPDFLADTGRFAEAISAWQKLRDQDPLNQNVAGGLSEAYADRGDYVAAMAEFDRGIQLEGAISGSIRGTALLAALAQRDKAEILRRVADMQADGANDPNQQLGKLLDQPAEGLALISRLLANKSLAPLNRLRLAYWRAYFGDAPGALVLLQDEFHRSPVATIIPRAMWRPVLRDVRRLPGFKQLLRDMGLIEFYRNTTWPDLCKPVGADDFECT